MTKSIAPLPALAAFCLAALVTLGVEPRQAGAQSFPYTLTVVNRCNRLIYVARRVRDPAGHWVTHGWMVMRAGATLSRNLRTHNRVFYLYAFSAGRRLTWSGQSRTGSIRRPVIQRAFSHTSGPLSGPQMRVVSFAKKEIRQGAARFTQSYSCPNAGAGGTARGGQGGGSQGRGSQGGSRDPGASDPGGRDPGGGGSSGGGDESEGAGNGAGNSGGNSRGSGGGTQLGGVSPGLAALRGRQIWVSVKARTPARDYCAILRRAGLRVECDYGYNVPASLYKTIIVECPTFRDDAAASILKVAGLTGRVRIYDWRKPSNAGKCKNFFGIKLRLDR
ncbi:MAG TPA: hypothetical protein VM325_01165 [Alphaproteobacteria bacterium]|nr:hypothetical protein [Alphaproteobacteria bacterium]